LLILIKRLSDDMEIGQKPEDDVIGKLLTADDDAIIRNALKIY